MAAPEKIEAILSYRGVRLLLSLLPKKGSRGGCLVEDILASYCSSDLPLL